MRDVVNALATFVTVGDIGDGITVRVNLQLVQRLGGERLGGAGPRRVGDDRRVYIHDQDRFASVARLGERVQIGEVQAGVPIGEPPVRPDWYAETRSLCAKRRHIAI
jgi:hypothetical protein